MGAAAANKGRVAADNNPPGSQQQYQLQMQQQWSPHGNKAAAAGAGVKGASGSADVMEQVMERAAAAGLDVPVRISIPPHCPLPRRLTSAS
jgi:hypothetical protein